MDLEQFHDLAMSLDDVRRRTVDGAARWVCHGRLVAREVDATHVVVRVPFEVRDTLVRDHPRACTVPARYAAHMKVVIDLAGASDDAVEAAVVAAWQLQSGIEKRRRQRAT